VWSDALCSALLEPRGAQGTGLTGQRLPLLALDQSGGTPVGAGALDGGCGAEAWAVVDPVVD